MSSPHLSQVRVRYGETDQMGVVYHANYLYYFEIGRTELLRSRGMAYAELEKEGIFLAVAESGCRYRGKARYDDLLTVETVVHPPTGARVNFEYRIIRGEDEICTGFTTLACLDDNGRPRRLPDKLKEAL